MGTLGWMPGMSLLLSVPVNLESRRQLTVAGIILFTLFGAMAFYSGYLIWRVFLGVDSFQFPARNYGDLGMRTWGKTARHVTNFLQALGLLLLLGQVVILFGLNISEMSKFRLCYVVCPILFVIAGFLLTQIRTLKAYGWVANMCVFLNILAVFITMGVIAHSPPNYHIAKLGSVGSAVDPSTITPDKNGNYPPIMHYTFLPTNGLVGSINGLLSGVLAYAGDQLFVEFLAEMKRPWDFIKSVASAQLFIYVVYIVFGCYSYFWQGQYTFNPSFQGVSTYGWQTVGNTLTLVSGLIAAGLYGNIGVKVFYNNVCIDLLNAPLMDTRRGKLFYAAIVPIWWIIAFIIAAGIPDYFGFVSVISASCLLNLTYTFPPFFALGFDIQRNAIRENEGEGFDITTGQVTRPSNETKVQRWTRGFLAGGRWQVALNIWHVIYFLASLAMCGLGMYAAVQGKSMPPESEIWASVCLLQTGMIDAFKIPELNSFSCVSPLDLSA